MVRHSHEDALTEASFNDLVATAQELPKPFAAECTAVLYLAGRLGLRAGEISHIRESWLNRENKVIQIPPSLGVPERSARRHLRVLLKNVRSLRWNTPTT